MISPSDQAKRLRGGLNARQRERRLCACGRGILITWHHLATGTGPTQCNRCRTRGPGARAKQPIPAVPTIVDNFEGTGRCLGAWPESCGVRWGNLDHRHCPCGEPIAAYWMPELDRIQGESREIPLKRRLVRLVRVGNQVKRQWTPLTQPPQASIQYQPSEGCCGRCEVRNLPLSQRVWTERAETEGKDNHMVGFF